MLPPAGLSWSELVLNWVDDCGGWLPLADQLLHRAAGAVDIADDPQTVERGLRRLSRRGHQPGGQYGRWMLRFFGVTSPVERLVRWLGTGHSRFSDLPCGLRLEHLALWNRPPVSESSLVCWIYTGTASAHFSRLDLDACDHWLSRAEPLARTTGINAQLEAGLLRAQLAAERTDHVLARDTHARLEPLLSDPALSAIDAECYRARFCYQRALLFTRPPEGETADIERARREYESIPESRIPFVSFRRSVGLSYCAWKLGDLEEATRLARRAVDDAGDAGLIRMRVAALNMLSRVVAPDVAAAVNERARRMAAQLGDEELMQRVTHSAPAPA